MDQKITNSLLYLDGVSVSFDGFKALNSLSFVVAPGELRAIIGPNGAGKTTMMDIITGKTRPDTGTVYFDGQVDLTKKDEADIAKMVTLGLPFWLAGAWATPERVAAARAAGAEGVQCGTVFALAEESGLAPQLRAPEHPFSCPVTSGTGRPRLQCHRAACAPPSGRV